MKIYIKQEDAGMSHCDSALRIAMEVWVLERLDAGSRAMYNASSDTQQDNQRPLAVTQPAIPGAV